MFDGKVGRVEGFAVGFAVVGLAVGNRDGVIVGTVDGFRVDGFIVGNDGNADGV